MYKPPFTYWTTLGKLLLLLFSKKRMKLNKYKYNHVETCWFSQKLSNFHENLKRKKYTTFKFIYSLGPRLQTVFTLNIVKVKKQFICQNEVSNFNRGSLMPHEIRPFESVVDCKLLFRNLFYSITNKQYKIK